jgi:peroxin-3
VQSVLVLIFLNNCSLKKRFFQNQQDCTFTALALLPGLGSQILAGLDVEGVIQVLQDRSRHRESNGPSQSEPSFPSNALQQDLPSNITPTLPTMRTTGDPNVLASATSDIGVGEISTTGHMGESALSWVEQFYAGSSNGARSPSMAEAQLSDSMISGSLSTTSEAVRDFMIEKQSSRLFFTLS